MTLTAPTRPTTAKVVDRELRRDLDAYLAPYGTLDGRASSPTTTRIPWTS